MEQRPNPNPTGYPKGLRGGHPSGPLNASRGESRQQDPASPVRSGVEERLDSPAQGRGPAMVGDDVGEGGCPRPASPRNGTELPAILRPPVQDPSANQGCAQVTRRRVHAVPGGWHWRGAAAARLRGWWGRNTREDHAAGPLEVADGLFAVGQVFQGLPRIPRRVEPSPADQHLGAAGADSKLEDRRGPPRARAGRQGPGQGEAPPRRRPAQAAGANTGAGAPR